MAKIKPRITLLITLLIILSFLLTSCNLAEKLNTDSSECAGLKDTAKDNCYFEALKCSKISAELTRDTCVVELAKIKKDLAVCNLIVTEKVKANCQEQIAELTNEQSICNQIKDRYWEDNCQFHLAVNNNKSVYCSLIKNDQQRADCFTEIAFATNDQLLCEFLDAEGRDKCLFKIAAQTKNIEICQEITGDNKGLGREMCRLKVAKVSEDKSKCELIKSKDVKQLCLEYFAGK